MSFGIAILWISIGTAADWFGSGFAELRAARSAKWDTFEGGVESAGSELETAFAKLAN